MQQLAMLVCLFGCAPAATKPDAAPSPRAPMTAEWVVQSAPAGQLSVIARIDCAVAFVVPINVSITVPEGLRLVSGRTSFAIPEGTPAGVTDEALVFEIVQPPAQDLLLEADARGPDFGVHAKRALSLTAKPPSPSRLTAPDAKAPDLEIGPHNFGPSVPAKP